MKLTGQQFLDQPHKAVTLIGMSNVGKTHTSGNLAQWGWHNYSCDFLIDTVYLKDVIGGKGATDPSNISRLSEFVGQIGNPAKGGKTLKEFNHSQRLYYNAECAVLRDIGDGIALAKSEGRHFVNDSSGSLCEVEDESILAGVGGKSLIVYLKASQQDYSTVLRRALENPKPLYFPPDFFNDKLKIYKADFDLVAAEEIDPKAFLQWVFPQLLKARLPKYQRLADRYGVTISSDALKNLQSEKDFLSIVAGALDKKKLNEPAYYREPA